MFKHNLGCPKVFSLSLSVVPEWEVFPVSIVLCYICQLCTGWCLACPSITLGVFEGLLRCLNIEQHMFPLTCQDFLGSTSYKYCPFSEKIKIDPQKCPVWIIHSPHTSYGKVHRKTKGSLQRPTQLSRVVVITQLKPSGTIYYSLEIKNMKGLVKMSVQ